MTGATVANATANEPLPPAANDVPATNAQTAEAAADDDLPGYAELHCLSAFSFQRGASTADELFERAKRLGYDALAITDECSLAGIVRALEASERHDLHLIVGSELRIEDGPTVVLLCADQPAYEALCLLITRARRRADKGCYRSLREDFDALPPGLLCLWLPEPATSEARVEAEASWLQHRFADRLWIGIGQHREADDAMRRRRLEQLSLRLGLPLVAHGDVHMHARGRRALQDTLTAIRHHVAVAEAGFRLFQNGERHLRRRDELAKLYTPQELAQTRVIAARCRFQLRELRYTYPKEVVPEGHTPTSWLRRLVEDGLNWRWPDGVSTKVRRQIEHELALIIELQYESYFLTVADIVRFARGRGILCQGRGSAANSAVCHAIGVTAVSPEKSDLLFERFLSRERNEPPDIDIDFEHERREEVIQYVFERYGRERAALTAVAIRYRGRSALRDVAKALGMAPDEIDALARTMTHWDHCADPQHVREAGFDPDSPLLRRVLVLAAELARLPRHLSQHPGGFVICDAPLHTLVPVENAAMDGRTVIQWDKDDLDTLGLMKVDVLGLGMLTAVRKTLALLRATGRRDFTDMAQLPQEDAATYDMICRADTLGVFQIESRAQMAMLPRLQPRCFYDLVIEVAIVRPGPIQGDMVHPYLRRRRGEEDIDHPPQLAHIFKRTLGVPLFQEQVMQLAIDAAGFTAGQADQLRRSMAAWKRRGGLEPHRDALMAGMLARGYGADYANTLFERIKGFGDYGFPESHAASFALITYASCWLKCHEPAAFAASLVNSQPLGFYSSDQILQDARRHGIAVRPLDVRFSYWDCTLEEDARSRGGVALRMGLRMVSGLREDSARALVAAREEHAFIDVEDLVRRSRLDGGQQAKLADAGALKGLAGHRHRARWAVSGVEARLPLFDAIPATAESRPALPLPDAWQDMAADYAHTGTTLGRHPLAMLRGVLRKRRCLRSSELAALPHGRHVRFAGLVTMRQRPETAKGTTFLTLEDEDGMVNAVVWQDLARRQRQVLHGAQFMALEARLERVDGVQHLIVQRMQDYGGLLDGVRRESRDFR
ncbi:MAG: error-prone DNA polymerase [Pseudoxanthomonas suwonensis]|nr:error-prone DNA polymerase [Pseudoxanthomonas suwonensis]